MENEEPTESTYKNEKAVLITRKQLGRALTVVFSEMDLYIGAQVYQKLAEELGLV